MSWQFPGGISRRGDLYGTAEAEPSDGQDGYEDGYEDGDEDVWDEDYDAYLQADTGRWRWVATLAGAVVLVAIVATWVILKGGDSASTAAKVVPPRGQPTLTPPSSTSTQAPTMALPPETVTTLSPPRTSTAEAAPPSPTQTATPRPTSPPAPTGDPRTIVYTVTGTKRPFDPVTVTYTDDTGALRTDFDVSLPWSKTIVVTGNVPLKSVTAISIASHLNCAITDANGQTVVAQNYNTIAATCNH